MHITLKTCAIGDSPTSAPLSLVTLVAGSLNHTPILPRGNEIPTEPRRHDNQFSPTDRPCLIKEATPTLAEVMTAIRKPELSTLFQTGLHTRAESRINSYPVMAGLRCYKGVKDFSTPSHNKEIPQSTWQFLRV